LRYSTAILIFANSASKDAERKAFTNSETLFHNLNQRTQHIVDASGLPYIVISETQQKGLTFGERFCNAIFDVFKKGYDKVICIGNDTPQINAKVLLKAHLALQNNKSAIGRSTDGGFYLLGISREEFCWNDFLSLPWQTAQLFEKTAKLIGETTEIELLKTLQDIDNKNDLLTFKRIYRLLPSFLKIYLSALTCSEIKPLQNISLPHTFINCLYFNKAPPKW
jgi:glycosyltransferase A (GT-A) superfamily protein (DUF2064 family)